MACYGGASLAFLVSIVNGARNGYENQSISWYLGGEKSR